jgi:hypothetical protein
VSDALVCWKCGASLDGLPLPLGRREECPACHCDLHVCRLCLYYDTAVSRACREPVAEEVKDKERSNFCGYFQARPGAYRPVNDASARDAQAQLNALFGGDAGADASGSPRDADAAREALEQLFGKKP